MISNDEKQKFLILLFTYSRDPIFGLENFSFLGRNFIEATKKRVFKHTFNTDG